MITQEKKGKEKVIIRLLDAKWSTLTKNELKQLDERFSEFMITLEIMPEKVIKRRYGLTTEKIADYLKNKAKLARRLEKCKATNKNKVSVTFPEEGLLEELAEHKLEIIGLLRDGAQPKDIFDRFEIFPNIVAYRRFLSNLSKDGYDVSKYIASAHE